MKKFSSLVGLVLVLAGAMSGCGDTINEGNFGVMKGRFSGKYDNAILTSGWHWEPLSDVYEVSERDMSLMINTDPKDVDGLALPQVQMEIRVKVNNPHAVPNILRNTLQLEGNEGVYLVGYSRLKTEAMATVREASGKLKADFMFINNAGYAEEVKKLFQEKLTKSYADLFTVTVINVLKVDVPDFVQTKISSVAAREAERERNNASMEAMDSREKLQKREANLLRSNIIESGLTQENFVKMETLKMIRDISEDGASSDNKSSMPTIILNLQGN